MYLSIYLSIYSSIYLSYACLSICLSIVYRIILLDHKKGKDLISSDNSKDFVSSQIREVCKKEVSHRDMECESI